MSKKRSDESIVADPNREGPDDSASGEFTGVAHGDVSRRAYELFEGRGREHGKDLNDWLQAEREVQTPQTALEAPGRQQ